MSGTKGKTSAMVLSGGSVYAAYEVGVIKALLLGKSSATDFQPLAPAIFTGTSAGSINATIMVSQPGTDLGTTIRYLEEVWLNQLAGDSRSCQEAAIRMRGDLTKYLDLRCLGRSPLKLLNWFVEDSAVLARECVRNAAKLLTFRQSVVRQVLNLFDVGELVAKDAFESVLRKAVNLEGIRRSPRVLRIAATNWRTGQLRIFKNEDMTDEIGHRALFASSVFPGLPPVLIDGEPYVDGGYVLNTPLHPAWEAGAEIMHVVYMSPDVSKIPLRDVDNTIDVLDKLYHVTMATILERDIQLAADINLGLAMLASPSAASELAGPEMRGLLRLAGRVQEAPSDLPPFRKLTIHRHHPSQDMGGMLGLLNWDRQHVQKLVDRGFQDGITHDCHANQCVFPP